MIAKNEEANLPRLFKSIKPLLEKPYVELIFVDTGSVDNTKKIAQKYTNNIYFFEWNNSFSDARNYSISKAKGDYVLILDADDELQKANQLIQLVESNKMYEFNTIIFKIVNILENGSTILEQPRLFKRTKDFKYHGTVHNQPTINEPISRSDITLYHYGYRNKEILHDKMRNRTIPLLLAELKENPNDFRLLLQLQQSYMILSEYPHVYEIASKAIKLKEDTDVNINDGIFTVSYYYVIQNIILNDLNTAINIINNILQHYKNHIDFLMQKSAIYNMLGYKDKQEECHKLALKYVKENKEFYYEKPYEFYSLSQLEVEIDESTNHDNRE